MGKVLSNRINRRGSPLHLCWGSPCRSGEERQAIHVVAMRWFERTAFDAAYMKVWGRMVLKEFAELDKEEAGEGEEEKKRPLKIRNLDEAKNQVEEERNPVGAESGLLWPRVGQAPRSQRAAAREAPGPQGKVNRGEGRGQGCRGHWSSDETEEAEEEEENSEEPETRLGAGDKLKGRATQLALGDVKGEEEEASEKEEKRKKRVKRKKKKKQDPQAQLLAQAVQARAAREAEDKEKKSRKKATEDRKR
jgi:hypothetical protein